MSDVQNTESLKIFHCLTNYNNYNHYYYIIIISITVNRGCLLNRGFKNCTVFVNDQHLTVTLYCEKVGCRERS